MTDYTRPPRCPDSLLTSDLPDWAKIVWLAVRRRQGSNDEAWAFYETYAEDANKSRDMVKKAVGLLKSAGWLEQTAPASRGVAPRLRCLCPTCPERGEQDSPKGENEIPTLDEKGGTTFPKGGNHIPERGEQGSPPPTPPYKEEAGKEAGKEAGQRAREARGTDRFEDWWKVYPKKRAKKACRAKWKARKLDRMADDLIADVERRKARDERWKRGYAPDPSTYLNQDRWEDELTEPTRAASAVDAARERAAEARANPAAAFQRNALTALAALDPGYPGVGDTADHEGRRLGRGDGALDG